MNQLDSPQPGQRDYRLLILAIGVVLLLGCVLFLVVYHRATTPFDYDCVPPRLPDCELPATATPAP
jgi:hypothetical protein